MPGARALLVWQAQQTPALVLRERWCPGCPLEWAQRGKDGLWLPIVFLELKRVLLARMSWPAGHSPHWSPTWPWPSPQDSTRCSDILGEFLATSRSIPESWRWNCSRWVAFRSVRTAFRSRFSVRFTTQLRSHEATETRGTAVRERSGLSMWGCPTDCRPTNTHSPLWTGWGRPRAGHLAGWTAFGSNRNLFTEMVALGFYEADKIIRLQTNSV